MNARIDPARRLNFAEHTDRDSNWRLFDPAGLARERVGHDASLAYAPWPRYDESLLQDDTVKIAVQVNGKVRASIQVAPAAPRDEVLTVARGEANVARYLEGRALRREIYVPGKIVNLVVE